MNDVTYNIVKPANIDKKYYTFSDDDIQNLKSYINQQNHSNVEDDDQENRSIDYYLNQILAEISQPLPDIYQYHHSQMQDVHDEPITSLPFDFYSTFSLEIIACGMQKNTQLPIPHENFSLTNGTFGDDAGFTMKKAQHTFLGKFKKLKLKIS